MVMRLYRCTEFTKDCYPCDHRYRHSYNASTCTVQCQHNKDAKCELCEGDMYINERRDMALVEARGEEYLDRMGKSIEDITDLLRGQDHSTWNGFADLLAWAKQQDWWTDFLEEHGMVMERIADGDTEPATFEYFPVTLLDPDEFADAITTFLEELDEQKEKEPGEGESTESTEGEEPDAPQGKCNGSVWSNCTLLKCQHYVPHDITDCKSHYCHDIKRMVWCNVIRKAGDVTQSTVLGPINPLANGGNGQAGDVWST
jgi:hypothetical protein